MGLAREPRDGLLRVAVADIPEGELLVTVGSGRVELGRTAGQQVRVRWTLPGGAWAGWPARLRGTRPAGPRVRPDAAGLRIEARRARLRIDVPDVVKVTVKLRRGEITSWGAGAALALSCVRGRIICRELVCRTLRAAGRDVNLHFAVPPEAVDVDAAESVLALPPGAYALTVPKGAEVEIDDVPTAACRITVSGGPTRILASQAPLSLRDEAPEGSADGG